MERHRLFRVIVLGGVGLVAACGGEVVAQHDAAAPADAAVAEGNDDASETILFDAGPPPVDASPPIVDAGQTDGGFPQELPPP